MLDAPSSREPPGRTVPAAASYLALTKPLRKFGSTVKISGAQADWRTVLHRVREQDEPRTVARFSGRWNDVIPELACRTVARDVLFVTISREPPRNAQKGIRVATPPPRPYQRTPIRSITPCSGAPFPAWLAPGGFEAQPEGVTGAVAVAGAQRAVLLRELALDAPRRDIELQALPEAQHLALPGA